MYRSEPKPALDYEDQDDLYVSAGFVEGLYQGVRVGAFSSRTFSRAGETFVSVQRTASASEGDSAIIPRLP